MTTNPIHKPDAVANIVTYDGLVGRLEFVLGQLRAPVRASALPLRHMVSGCVPSGRRDAEQLQFGRGGSREPGVFFDYERRV
jgi:hypothetical protein